MSDKKAPQKSNLELLWPCQCPFARLPIWSRRLRRRLVLWSFGPLEPPPPAASGPLVLWSFELHPDIPININNACSFR